MWWLVNHSRYCQKGTTPPPRWFCTAKAAERVSGGREHCCTLSFSGSGRYNEGLTELADVEVTLRGVHTNELGMIEEDADKWVWVWFNYSLRILLLHFASFQYCSFVIRSARFKWDSCFASGRNKFARLRPESARKRRLVGISLDVKDFVVILEVVQFVAFAPIRHFSKLKTPFDKGFKLFNILVNLLLLQH